MTRFVPIFPLELVVYPGEKLNLHIFEPRYIALITDCLQQNLRFGIPVVLAGKVQEYGTAVRIHEVVTTYDDGRMDITVQGVEVLRVLELLRTLPDKLYAGAIVNYPENDSQPLPAMAGRVAEAIRELHRYLQVSKPFARPDAELLSYDMAHHAGLKLAEAYDLLQLMREDQRLELLRRHLQQVLEVMRDMEGLKEKIKRNGHFRELRSLGFDEDNL